MARSGSCHDVIRTSKSATEAERCAPDSEPQEVRCCASTAIEGYAKRTCIGKTLWTESDSAGFGGCQHNLTWSAADALCKKMGARLCTRAEVASRCTAGTGCFHDSDLIWTSSSELGELSPPSDLSPP